MGPQSLDCGRLKFKLLLGECESLQWGRSHSTAEGEFDPVCPKRDPTCFNGAAVTRLRKVATYTPAILGVRASMGPQSLDCGRSASWIASFVGCAHASMGPQSLDCGR